MLSEQQFVELLFHFDQYKKSFEQIPREEYMKYNFLQRKKIDKAKKRVFDFWEELDKLE